MHVYYFLIVTVFGRLRKAQGFGIKSIPDKNAMLCGNMPHLQEANIASSTVFFPLTLIIFNDFSMLRAWRKSGS
jgi:hypothetical protein